MILLFSDFIIYLVATGRRIQGARMCITWAGVQQEWQVYNPNWLEVWWISAASYQLIKDWDVCQLKWEITDCWTQPSVLKEGNKDLFNSGLISKRSSALRDIPDCKRVHPIKYRKLSVRYGFGYCGRGTKDPDGLSLICLILCSTIMINYLLLVFKILLSFYIWTVKVKWGTSCYYLSHIPHILIPQSFSQWKKDLNQ